MLHAEFKVLGGKHQGRSIPINTKKFLVGREQDCHLRPNNDLVSRHHCVFIVDDFTVRLRDLGSTNGTRVNGELVRNERVLTDGDRITIGKLELEIVIREHAAVAAPAANVPVAVAATVADGPLSFDEGVASSATVEIPISGLDTTLGGSAGETAYELPVFPGASATQPVGAFAGDTAILGGATVPGMMPGLMPMGMPPGYPMMPGYPQQMGYPPNMGYPQGYPGYPPMQPMPGYPMGYPMGGAPGYPPMQGYPGMPAPAAPENSVATTVTPVKLPDPETTGLPAPPPPPPPAPAPVAAADGSIPAPPPSDKPSNTAADIIKNYMQRRTNR